MSSENGKPVKVSSGVRRITPDDALEILTRPGKNRPLSESIVERYAEAIRRGAWQLNGEPIILDKAGCLIDGQHRLHAIHRADIPVECVVVEGVEPTCITSIDTGISKTPAHFLGMMGERNGALLAATLGLVQRWHDGWPRLFLRRRGNDELIAGLARDPGVRLSVGELLRYRASWPFKGKATLRHFAFVHYAAALTCGDVAKADDFIEGVCKGLHLDETDPRYVLRQAFLAYSLPHGAELETYVLSRSIHAWNLWLAGKEIRYLRVEAIPAFFGEAALRQDQRLAAAQARLAATTATDRSLPKAAGSVSQTDQNILDLIGERGPMTSDQLATALGLSPGRINNLVLRLTNMGALKHSNTNRKGATGGVKFLYDLARR